LKYICVNLKKNVLVYLFVIVLSMSLFDAGFRPLSSSPIECYFLRSLVIIDVFMHILFNK